MIAQELLTRARAAGVDPKGKRVCRYSDSLECLKWAGAREAIRDLASRRGLELQRLDVIPASFLRSTTHYTLNGPEKAIWGFVQDLSRMLKAYEELSQEPVKAPKQGFFKRLASWARS